MERRPGIAVMLCAAVLTGAALYFARVVFEPAVFALFLIALVWPLQRNLAARMPAGLAMVCTLIVAASVIIVIGVAAAWGLGHIGGWVFANVGQLQAAYVNLTGWLESHGVLFETSQGGITGARVLAVTQGLAARLSDTAGFVMLAFVFVVLGLLEVEPIAARLDRLAEPPAPGTWAPTETGARMAAKFQRYMAVRAGASVLTGLGTALFAWGIGMDLPGAWGVLTFALNFIPFIGPLVVVIAAALFATAQFGTWQMVLLVVAGLTAIQFMIGSYAEPRMAGTAVSMSPFLVLFSVFLWGFLWGIPGAFIGVPVTIAVLALCEAYPRTRWVAELLAGPEKKV